MLVSPVWISAVSKSSIIPKSPQYEGQSNAAAERPAVPGFDRAGQDMSACRYVLKGKFYGEPDLLATIVDADEQLSGNRIEVDPSLGTFEPLWYD